MNATRVIRRCVRIGAVSGREFRRRRTSCNLGRAASIVSLLTMVSLSAVAAYEFRTEVNPDGTVTVYKGSVWPSGALTIPKSIYGRAVSIIGDAAFSDCTGLTSVAMPDGLRSIDAVAFSGCSGLTTITIPDSVTNIGVGAFSHCPGLVTAVIGDGVTSIGTWAFEGCTRLTRVRIPDSIQIMGGGVFNFCPIEDVLLNKSRTMLIWYPRNRSGGYTVPGTVSTIADHAFSGCTNLTRVTIPGSVARIGHTAFAGCTNLASVTLGNGVVSIGHHAFALSGFTSITIPRSVTSIGSYSFAGALALDGYFAGDAPMVIDGDGNPTNDEVLDAPNATIHYLPGTKGWTTVFGGRPTTPWHRHNPTILDFGDRFGPSTNGFSFVISWATNVPVIVEACMDLNGGAWTPTSTQTLTQGWVQFMDPKWRSQPTRFYRVRGP